MHPFTCQSADCLCRTAGGGVSLKVEPAPKTLEVLGVTADNRIAYRFSSAAESTEVMELTEDEVGILQRAFGRDFLPLWPTRPCRACGADSVVVLDGDNFCEGHAMAFGRRESEGTR